MRINVTVERIIFENTQNGFTVMVVSDNSAKKGDTFKATANTVGIERSMNLILEGDWDSANKYGKTFKVTKWEEVLPSSPSGIELYLASGLIKGVGTATAKAIVECFGDKAFNIIDSHSMELTKVPRISKKKAEQIWESWDKHKHMRKTISYMLECGVSVTMAIKIFKMTRHQRAL